MADTMNDTIQLLIEWDEAYEKGDSLVPDLQYDQTKREAHKKYTTHPYFITVGATVRGGKVNLPFIMGSLNQVYEGETLDWVRKYNLENEEIVISHKLDGTSGMERYNNGSFQIAYSRGNGVQGADISRHVKLLPSNPQSLTKQGHLTVRGEMIVKNATFFEHHAEDYTTARAMVAGCMNSSITSQSKLDNIDFIVYAMVDADADFATKSQSEDLDLLKSLGFQTVPYIIAKGADLTDDFLTKVLADARTNSEYELDGIVLTINKKSAQKNLSGSSSLNPEHSVKYKVLDANSYIETEVVDVLWELSKSGFFKPRIEIRPVVLFGTTVTYATGFNGKFINDNGIGRGAKVIITKSGMVIPYITEVTHSVLPKMPERKWIWNDNGVEAVLEDAHNDPEVIFKQVLDFTNSLNIDLLKESNLGKVIATFKMGSQSYESIIEVLVNLFEGEWINAIGSNGSKIHASLQRRLNNLTMAQYLGSVKFMGFGFGVRKAKSLVKPLNDQMDVWNLSVSDIEQMDGFDTKTATAIAKGLPVAKAFAETLGLKFVQEVKTSEFANFNIVFTGFRDKALEEKLEKMGAKMGSAVSKKTTHLVTAEPNSTSTKAKKAREIGVKTLSIDEFKEEYNL